MAVDIQVSDISKNNALRIFTVTGLTGTAILTGSNQAVDIAIPGVLATDIMVQVTAGVAPAAGLGAMSSRVKAAGIITVFFCNPTAGSVTSPTALTFVVAHAV